MQIYPNSGGTQAAAVWALCQSAQGRHIVLGTGEVTLFSYSAGLIRISTKKKKVHVIREKWKQDIDFNSQLQVLRYKSYAAVATGAQKKE